jgi:hypothetical protein
VVWGETPIPLYSPARFILVLDLSSRTYKTIKAILGLVEGGPSFDGASGYEDTITGLCSPDWQDELSGFPVRAHSDLEVLIAVALLILRAVEGLYLKVRGIWASVASRSLKETLTGIRKKVRILCGSSRRTKF